MAIRNVEMDFEYMNVIAGPPRGVSDMYSQACSNDKVTCDTWRKPWVEQARANHKTYGPFKDRGVGQLFGKYAQRPIIIAGSGPSLKNNIHLLKNPKGVPVLSVLHNFHYMVDHEVPVDYFVSLDAGAITLPEISEGGSRTEEEYWELTKNHKLICFIGTHPELLKKWKGEIYFFTCPVPDEGIMSEFEKIEPFYTYVSTGGCVLGAATYIAKAIFGCNPIAFVGADFSFSYTKKFHPWKSKYDDNVGEALRTVDVYGNRVLTWQSYFNFKTWFDWLSCTVAGIYINCSEGGTLGAYPEGNILQIQQMPLERFLWMYSMYQEIRAQCENPSMKDMKILF